ncbi:MAG TPA: hypothetical protein VHT03_06085 [Rhizomicrobium sp.]|jgi:hypothetical protein|nr:hypothetical protein [Rhizomicrobium sp.]
MLQIAKTAARPNGRGRALLLASMAMVALAAPAQAKPTFITFDVQGASSTDPTAINSTNVVTGSASGFDGFVRAADGTITTFDVPNANGTFPQSINDDGTITGWYFDSSYQQHGFVRSPDGTITAIDHGSSGTVAVSLNTRGFIAGTYTCGTAACGYSLSPGGKYRNFAVSGSAYTSPSAINARREVAGYYLDGNYQQHGFLRAADGTITGFDVSGAMDTDPGSLNAKGVTTGTYVDNAYNIHGFLRASDGTITEFDAPNATFGTFPSSINTKGAIAGSYDIQNEMLGFFRAPNGRFRTVLVKGSTGTTVNAINDARVGTGYYLDSSSNAHGFLWMP